MIQTSSPSYLLGYLPKSLHLSEPQFSHLKNGDNDGTYLKELFCESNEKKKKKQLRKVCDSAWHTVVYSHLNWVNSYSSFKAQLTCSFICKVLSDTKIS